MRELGYVDGGNIAYEYRWARGVADRLPALAAELVQVPVDLIVVGTNAAIAAAKQATSTIPIVMVLAADPVRQGFIQSLARPGGNITGLAADPGQEMQGKMLQLLKEIVPGLSAVGCLPRKGLDTTRPLSRPRRANWACDSRSATSSARSMKSKAPLPR